MFIYPAKSYSLRHGGGGATVGHTTYLFPEVDGFMEATDAAYGEVWLAGTKTGQSSVYLNNIAEGVKNTLEDKIYIPALPDVSFWVDYFGYVDMGEHRTTIYIRTLGASFPLTGDWGDSSYSAAKIHASQQELIDAVSYTDTGAVVWPEYAMHEYDIYDNTYYVTSNGTFNTESYSGDYEGEYIQWALNTITVDNSGAGTRKAHIDIWTRELYQSTLLNTGVDGWNSVRVRETASAQHNPDTYSNQAMLVTGAVDSTASVHRAFFTFNMSEFDDAVERTITAATFDIYGYDNDANDDSDEAVLQVSQHTESAGELTTSNFTPTGSGLAAPSIKWEQDENNLFRNQFLLNATGMTELEDAMDTGDNMARFCTREYIHDYLDSAPGSSTTYKNGMYFKGQARIASITLKPKIEIVYDKVAEWTDRTVEAQWTVATGSWNGSGWTSSGSTLDISDTGGWTTDYRPAGMRITYTGQANVVLNLYDADTVKVIYEATYISGDTDTILWGGNEATYNIDNIVITAGGEFTVTKIEFLER
jgi:hypothetical protein